MVRIVGVDPGLANLGLGAIEASGNDVRLLESQLVRTRSRDPDGARLAQLYDALLEAVMRCEADALVVEGQFFHRQRDAATKVGQALGVVHLAAHRAGLAVHSYGPLQVKQALVGTGRADKAQVAFMVRALLGMTRAPGSHHESDALALALTHWSAHRVGERAASRGGPRS